MRIFIDANVIVSVLNKEYPLFTFSSRILSLSDNDSYQVFTSPICLAIAFYFAEKKYTTRHAKTKIQLASQNMNIAAATEAAVQQALENPKIKDFEDGLEYYAAVENKCDCIITEDVKDFYFSEIEVLTCQGFFDNYLAKVK